MYVIAANMTENISGTMYSRGKRPLVFASSSDYKVPIKRIFVKYLWSMKPSTANTFESESDAKLWWKIARKHLRPGVTGKIVASSLGVYECQYQNDNVSFDLVSRITF